MQEPSEKSAPGLVRALGPFTAIAIVVGTVIGSGIFKKPQEVAENVPFFGLAASVWILGGVLALLGALAVSELAVLFPHAGGNYVYLREGFGRPAAFLSGWVEFWIIRGASIAALATIFTEALWNTGAIPPPLRLGSPGSAGEFWQQKGLTVAIIMSLTLVNVRGVRWGGFLQLFITLVKVGSLAAIILLPIYALLAAPPSAPKPDGTYLLPAWPADGRSIDFGRYGTALVSVLFAYHGWMSIAPVAAEVHHPQRNLPLALLGGTGLVVALYLGANLGYYLMIPQPDLAEMKKPSVAEQLFFLQLGQAGAVAASIAMMLSTFGAMNGNLLVGPRLVYAMGEDGLAPRSLGAVHATYRTPSLAILITGLWASILVLTAASLLRYHLIDLGTGDETPREDDLFNLLTSFAIFGSITFETLAVATIFVFRWRLPQVERPYRCWGYPVVPALYVFIMALVLINMFRKQPLQSLVGVGFIAVGALVYFVAVDRTTTKKEEAVAA